MKNQGRHARLVAAGLVLLGLLLAGCGLAPSTTPRASDDWSNGRLVGIAALSNPVGFHIDPAGGGYLVWVGLDRALHLAQLDDQATVTRAEPLALEVDSPVKPQLAVDAAGQLHLTWLDKAGRSLRLVYARLAADGVVLRQTEPLSIPEQRVMHSSMVYDPVGGTIEVFWSDDSPNRPGVHHAAVDALGAIVTPAEVLIPNGLTPDAQVDRQGYVHLAWRTEPAGDETRFHYAVYDPRRRLLGPEMMAMRPAVRMGLIGGPTAAAEFEGPIARVGRHFRVPGVDGGDPRAGRVVGAELLPGFPTAHPGRGDHRRNVIVRAAGGVERSGVHPGL